MPNDMTLADPTPERKDGRKSSTATKLVQAAVLAAMLVPLGSVAVETTEITCGFYGASNECGGTGGTRTYDFGDYKYILTFFGMTEPFTVKIEDLLISQGAFSERESLPGDYDCVLITGAECVEFLITSSDGKTWDSYQFTIAWLFNTESMFPNGSDPEGSIPGQIRVLQNSGLVPGEDFTIDMCLAFPDPGCQYFSGAFDPAISSGDTDFSSQIVGFTAVPEPATLFLVGGGLGGILYRRRRRRRLADPLPTA